MKPILTKALNKSEIELLFRLETKLLRRIGGLTCENGIWRRRKTRDRPTYAACNEISITSFIKISRAKWLGHP